MRRFYMTLGQAALPGYYGHNPLWGPVYLLLFGLLALGTSTGLALGGHDTQALLVLAATPWWLGWTLPEWHAGVAVVVATFGAAHILAVFVPDARGSTSEISAMVNGHKFFIVTGQPQQMVNRIPIIPASRRSTGQD